MNNIIKDYNIEELLYIFDLDKSCNLDDLNKKFTSIVNNKNIGNNKINFVKDAYVLLKEYITKNKTNNKLFESDKLIEDRNILKWEHKPNNIGINENYFVKYKSSNLNPIKKQIITKLVNIDSIFRNNTEKANNFMFTLNEEINNVLSYKIVSVEIPNIWYTFSDSLKNNIFTITVNNYSTGVRDINQNIIYESSTRTEIVIPEGNYSRPELITIVNNILINTGNGLNFIVFDISEYTGKSSFRAKTNLDVGFLTDPKPFEGDQVTNVFFSPNFSFTINFDLQQDEDLRKFQNDINENRSNCEINDLSGESLSNYLLKLRPLYYNCGYLIGFQKNEYSVDFSNSKVNIIFDNQPITHNCYLESEGYYGDTINKYFFIKIDDFNYNTNNTIIVNNKDNLNFDNIIAKIPVSFGSFSMIYNNNSDQIYKEKEFFGPVNISKMRISLVDRFNRLIDIGESNYAITIEFKILYS